MSAYWTVCPKCGNDQNLGSFNTMVGGDDKPVHPDSPQPIRMVVLNECHACGHRECLKEEVVKP